MRNKKNVCQHVMILRWMPHSLHRTSESSVPEQLEINISLLNHRAGKNAAFSLFFLERKEEGKISSSEGNLNNKMPSNRICHRVNNYFFLFFGGEKKESQIFLLLEMRYLQERAFKSFFPSSSLLWLSLCQHFKNWIYLRDVFGFMF